MKRSGVMNPSCGCCHRTSASTPNTLARLQVDFRLIDDAELVARDRVPEVAHQGQPLGAVTIELRRVHDAAGPILLSDIHGNIRALDEHFGFGAVLGRDGDAHTAVHVEVQPLDAERLLHRRNQLAGRQLGALLSYSEQHDGKLVATEPRDRIGLAHLHLQAMPDLPQHGVAHEVPHRVVDLLEAVEIHDEHRQRIPCAERVGDRHLEPILKQGPVRQVRQAVVVREMTNTLFGLRALTAHFGIAQLAVNRWNEPAQVVLDDVVIGAVLHRVDGNLLADRARDEDERHLESAIAHHRERGGAAKAGHRVIRDDEIPVLPVECLGERLGGVHACAVRIVPALAQMLDQERCVVFRILDQQETEGFHAVGLPGDPGSIELFRSLELRHDRLRVLQGLVLTDTHAEQGGGRPFDRIQDECGIPLRNQLLRERVRLASIAIGRNLNGEARSRRIGRLRRFRHRRRQRVPAVLWPAQASALEEWPRVPAGQVQRPQLSRARARTASRDGPDVSRAAAAVSREGATVSRAGGGAAVSRGGAGASRGGDAA